MKPEDIRDLKLLNEISSKGPALTQRSLAKTQGVALGLANLLIRRLVSKGYIKITNVQGKRLGYLLTPRGMAEKARLAYEYFDYSLYYYREIRQFLNRSLSAFSRTNRRNILIVGTGEVAEIAYLTFRALNLNLVGVLDEEADHRTFLRHPVLPLTELSTLSYDGIVIAMMKDRSRIHEQLVGAGIPQERIVAIPDAI